MNQSQSNRITWVFAAVALSLHLIATFAGQYGIFRDELYYIACADR